MPQVRKTDDLERASQNIITTYNILIGGRKTKRPIHLLRMSVKSMQKKVNYHATWGTVPTQEIDNLLESVLVS